MGKKMQAPVEVVAAEQMEDENFLRHLENRHPEAPMESGYRFAIEAWIGTYRAFHERCHRIAAPGQYDHVHEWEDEG